MNVLKVVISGGGTGGHIFPAISIADAIKRRFPKAEILFVGADNRMEMQRVPDAGYQIIGLPVSGFNRKNLLKNIKVVWKLQKSLRMAKKIINDFKPHIAIGVGGYASGPLLKVAASKGIPTLIQEQNSFPGLTNKLLAKKANVICVAYDGMESFFPKEKIVLTGTPCRESLKAEVSKEDAYAHFDLDSNKKTILFVGGSLGSRTINRSISNYLQLISETDVQILWQAGELFFHEYFMELNEKEGVQNIRLLNFIDRMDYAYTVADLVVSRAGAGAISELALLGKPTILIPSPNVSEDHQTKNAKALVIKNAAIMLPDDKAEESLVKLSLETVNDPNKLKDLSENIIKLAQPNSADNIVNEIIKIIKDKFEQENK